MATIEGVMTETDSRMRKSVESLSRDFNIVRTGRANPSLVEGVVVDYYGEPTPLNQLASISVPEARLLLIQPWDKKALSNIEKGILKSELGLVPNNDGEVIRVNIPTLTEERRRELVKRVNRMVEESHIAVRNIRRDSLERLRAMEKDKELSKDEGRKAQEQLQKLTDAYIARLNKLGKEKEAEILEV